jgi:signal transduction histidine kinase
MAASTNAMSRTDSHAVEALCAVANRGFGSVREAAQAIFGLMHELLGMRVCVLTRIDLDANVLTVIEAFDAIGLGVVSGMQLPADQMPCEFVVRSGLACREFDLDAHPAFRILPLPQKLGLRSYIGVPLRRSDGSVWGTLAAVDTEVCETTDAHVQTLVVLARLAAFEFEREEQRERLAAHAKMLSERLSVMAALEEERIRSVRLQAVLEAVATVSHEVNNPLTVLQLRLERMKKRCAPGDAEEIDDLEAALEAADEIHQVTKRLRNVVQPVSTHYLGKTRMLDLAASAADDGSRDGVVPCVDSAEDDLAADSTEDATAVRRRADAPAASKSTLPPASGARARPGVPRVGSKRDT